MNISLILAINNDGLIGDNNSKKMPWGLSIKEDLKNFKIITSTTDFDNKFNYLICGMNTYENELKNIKFGKSRKLIIIDRNIKDIIELDNGFYKINSLNNLEDLYNIIKNKVNKLFCIGGLYTYISLLTFYEKYINEIFLTLICKKYKVENGLYFPIELLKNFNLNSVRRVINKDNIKLDFCKFKKNYKNYNHPENYYLNICKKVLKNGININDRTNTGILSDFSIGNQIEYDCSNGKIPIITTKKVFLKSVITELLWFLTGSTDNTILKNKGVKIWNGNSTRDFLDLCGLNHLEENDCGAIYGHNLRYFGAKYENCNTDYKGKGFDQIEYVIDQIKNNPYSRRILFSFYDPNQLNSQVLPPCHLLYQFRVYDDKLCLHMYQRSGDMMLGVPFNITSSCLLLYIIAKLTNKKPWKFIHTIADAHIYSDHIKNCKIQLKRTPLPLPILEINENKVYEKVEDFTYEDFKILGYISHQKLSFKMAI